MKSKILLITVLLGVFIYGCKSKTPQEKPVEPKVTSLKERFAGLKNQLKVQIFYYEYKILVLEKGYKYYDPYICTHAFYILWTETEEYSPSKTYSGKYSFLSSPEDYLFNKIRQEKLILRDEEFKKVDEQKGLLGYYTYKQGFEDGWKFSHRELAFSFQRPPWLIKKEIVDGLLKDDCTKEYGKGFWDGYNERDILWRKAEKRAGEFILKLEKKLDAPSEEMARKKLEAWLYQQIFYYESTILLLEKKMPKVYPVPGKEKIYCTTFYGIDKQKLSSGYYTYNQGIKDGWKFHNSLAFASALVPYYSDQKAETDRMLKDDRTTEYAKGFWVGYNERPKLYEKAGKRTDEFIKEFNKRMSE